MSIVYKPELKPCPFCGGVAYEDSCDVLIQIGCEKCKFHIFGNGIITREKTDVPVPCDKDSEGNPVYPKEQNLWYDSKAHEKMYARWNMRNLTNTWLHRERNTLPRGERLCVRREGRQGTVAGVRCFHCQRADKRGRNRTRQYAWRSV